jgi:D-alanyl-D-alanine carboxypeptidase (penicillin-binding protein 5/6)
VVLLTVALALVPVHPAHAARGPKVGAKAGVLMDAATGEVLWSRAPHRAVLVASTTKMLTALVAEAAYKPRQRLRVPVQAENVDGTRFGFQKNMLLTREQLLTTLLLVSANDAAEVLATRYPDGGRRGFLAAMQAKCAELGCTDSTWRDPAGLDAPGHRASAADLALVGQALLKRPVLAKLAATRQLTFRWPGGRTQVITNHNKLVAYDRLPGMLGIKTGYTDKARHTLVAAQRRGGRTLIAVALGTDDIYGDVTAMLGYGFAIRTPRGAERLGVVPPEPATRTAPSGVANAITGTTLDLGRDRGLPSLSIPAAGGAAAVAVLLGIVFLGLSRRRRRSLV